MFDRLFLLLVQIFETTVGPFLARLVESAADREEGCPTLYFSGALEGEVKTCSRVWVVYF